MRALEIMSRPAVTVHPWTPIRDAAATLSARAITALPVVDAEENLVGIVSAGDLLWHRVPADPDAHLWRQPANGVSDPPGQVCDVMTTAVVSAGPDAHTADLAQAMIDHDVHSVPIVDGTKVVGIVSRRDLLRTLVHTDAVVAIEVRRALDEYAGHLPRWNLDVADGVVTISGTFLDEAEQRVVGLIARYIPGVRGVQFRPAEFPTTATPAGG
jgi:CBS domain-containing protein